MKTEKTILFFFIAIQLIALQYSKPYDCQFGKLYARSSHYKTAAPKPHEILLSGRRRLQPTFDPMRITLNTDDFDTIKTPDNGQDPTTVANLDFVKRSMKVAAYFYMSRLKVSPEGLIDIPSLCHDYSPPLTDVQTGKANSDMHIYVLYSTDSTVGYGATGVSCSWVTTSGVFYPDTSYRAGKPTAGRIIFNTYNLVDREDALTNRLFSSITATALHQTLHILGFDQSLYNDFMDSGGNLHTSMYESVSLHASRNNNFILKTPNVVAWAQDHFGCNTLQGVPLENEDGGIRGSHWERLTMYDQLMTGTALGPQKSFTALTFAMLKDMGWYQVDDSFNDTTNYGYQKGCEFIEEACYAASPDEQYFCNAAALSGISQCSTTFTGKSLCKATGTMSDGCGIFADHHYCVDEDAPINGYTPGTLEQFGITSYCTIGTMATVGIPLQYLGRCYPHICDYDNQRIIFNVGPYQIYCLSVDEGSTKTHSQMQGYITCPIFSDFCTNSRKFCPNWCSQKGFCMRGICNCYADDTVSYAGEDCSITLCTDPTHFYNPDDGTCSGTCPPGTYPNTQSRTCFPCASQCGQCRDEPDICTQCVSTPLNPQYYNTITDTCVSECPDGTFLDTDDKCYPCDDTGAYCATCVTSATMCLTCINGYYWTSVEASSQVGDHGTCSTVCSIGSYLTKDVVNLQCVATCPNYLILNTNDNQCQQCSTGYKVINQSDSVCTPSCGAGYWTDESRKVCALCDPSCDVCYDQFAENCTSCKDTGTLNYWFQDMCLETCPSGYYQNLALNKCILCDVTLFCKTCSFDGTTVTCDSCKYGYYLQTGGSVCALDCDIDEYKNIWNHTCEGCHSDCLTCTGPSQTQCVTCTNYYLKNQTGGYCLADCPPTGYVRMTQSCEPCHQSCLTCSGLTSANCQSCYDGYYLEAGRCRYVCSPGRYADEDTQTCEQCDPACTYCFGSTVDNCTQCVGLKVLYNFTCADSCPQNHSPNSYDVCELNKFEQRMTYLVIGLLGIFMILI